jgi:hypothetical protein
MTDGSPAVVAELRQLDTPHPMLLGIVTRDAASAVVGEGALT